MTRRLRALLSCALFVLLPLVTFHHGAEDRPAGTHLSAAGHGPHAPCPPAADHHCLACAAAALFAPPPHLARLSPPARGHAEWDGSAHAEFAARELITPGRSPPVS